MGALILEFGPIPFLAAAAFLGYFALRCIPKNAHQMPDWDILAPEEGE